MTDKRKATKPDEDVEQAPADTAPAVVVHDYDPVRPNARRKNVVEDSE